MILRVWSFSKARSAHPRGQLLPVPQPAKPKVKGGLLLDTREGLLKGGDTGPAIKPGDLDQAF